MTCGKKCMICLAQHLTVVENADLVINGSVPEMLSSSQNNLSNF